MILFIVFGGLVYYVLGDHYTPKVVLMKKALEDYQVFEWVFRVGVIIFYLSNTLGIPTFNVPLRDRIIRRYNENKDNGGNIK
jgi:hypothetical protein